MIELNYRDNRPLYEQIKSAFKKLILDGALKSGEKIPSVRELASSLSINPNTIAHAYKEMETEGFIYSQRAKGFFVAPEYEVKATNQLDDLTMRIREDIREWQYFNRSKQELLDLVETLYKKEETL